MSDDDTPFDVTEWEAGQLQRQLGLDEGFAPESVATALSVNISTIYRWLQSGRLKGKQVGKQWRITSGNVAELVETQERERQRMISARNDLRLAKKLKPGKEWRIETCVICEGPIVTDGGETTAGRNVLSYSPDGDELYACPWPLGCYQQLEILLGYGWNHPEVEPEDNPLE
jgi:excisionase family DNA binding protein